MDIASVDVIWNGFAQSLKIAALAETHEVACAPHNYYSHLATFIAAQWCAAIQRAPPRDRRGRRALARGAASAVPEIRDGELACRPGRAGAATSARKCCRAPLTDVTLAAARRQSAPPSTAFGLLLLDLLAPPRVPGGPYPGATALLLAACAVTLAAAPCPPSCRDPPCCRRRLSLRSRSDRSRSS